VPPPRPRLVGIRAALEAKLREGQRAVVAAYLDEGITSVRGLARRLDEDPRDVRRKLEAIARQVLRLA
jgi:hypothetical protein